MIKILAVASSGGHWDQLQMLRAAFAGHDAYFATTDVGLAEAVGDDHLFHLPDCNLQQWLASFKCLLCAARLVLRLRPQIIISTGAAPGFFCILIGRIMGARCLWIDSVANAARLSLSGRLALHVAHECLTQYPHLARENGPYYRGSVL